MFYGFKWVDRLFSCCLVTVFFWSDLVEKSCRFLGLNTKKNHINKEILTKTSTNCSLSKITPTYLVCLKPCSFIYWKICHFWSNCPYLVCHTLRLLVKGTAWHCQLFIISMHYWNRGRLGSWTRILNTFKIITVKNVRNIM